MIRCGVVGCGTLMVLYGMMWCVVVWCGVVKYGVVWYGMIWFGAMWCGMAVIIIIFFGIHQSLKK